jgi:hypothetical protein
VVRGRPALTGGGTKAWRRGRAYGQELRAWVLAALEEGGTVREVAARFAVSPSYAARVRLRREV